ncbi:hypothetical protein R3P38DRAFT_3212042 [Favolaschia claudopus]|uniref:Uncharacterized protein n=1 Tax=Favolaschia claudopus TaxID=2862362 RepID=A0AAW0AEH5_9AGAR
MLSDQGWNGLSGLSPARQAAPFPNDVLIHKRLSSPPSSPGVHPLNLHPSQSITVKSAHLCLPRQRTRRLLLYRRDTRGAFQDVPGFLAPARTVSASVISVVIMIVRSPPYPSFLHASPPASLARSFHPFG